MGPRRRIAAAALAVLAAASLATPSFAVAPGGGSATATGSTGLDDSTVGSWHVLDLGAGRYVVSWRSPVAFPLGADRPTIAGPADVLVGTPELAADGRTVRAVVTAATRPDPADFDVLLSGDRLDARGDDRYRTAATPARGLDLPGTETLPVDPATPGPYAVASSDYELDPVKLAGMPVPVEMVGHVVEPAADAATGPRPLVLFLHGRHSVCYDPQDANAFGDWPCQPPMQEIPSQLGYDYIQQVLASQGYATVSVRVNGINGQDWRLADGGADARAEIVEQHLDHWVTLAADHQVDLSRVVLVGHSRGGEGVDRAAIQIPLTAPYRIVGQVLIAPTDFGAQTAAYVPTVTLLPSCDGDVSDLQGQKFTDGARDLVAGDTSLKSSVLVMGANHNFFNTEWTPGLAQAPAWDDWGGAPKATCGKRNPDRLSPEEQQAVGTAYVAGAVHLFADDEQDLLPLFDGSRARVASTGAAQVLSHAIGGGRDERAPGVGVDRALPEGATTRLCQGMSSFDRVSACISGVGYAGIRPHWPEAYERVPTRTFFEMSWTAPGQAGGLLLEQPLDLSTGRLELRTIVDPEVGPADLQVRITDAEGASALLAPADGALPAIDRGTDVEKYWAQTLVVDPAGATGVDLARVVRVDLVSASDRGRVWVADLAAAPAALASVPDLRLPTVDVGSVRIPEGDGRSPVTAYLPVDVVGEITRPARLVVMTAGQARGSAQRFTLDLAPGQTSAQIPVTYQPDRADDYRAAITTATVWATRNVMTDAYVGRLTVLDDDPTPRTTVRPVARGISEGESARWRISMAKGVDYEQFVSGRVVRGPRHPVSAGDVDTRWIAQHLGPDADLDQPLWTFRPIVFARLRAGVRVLEIAIPVRRDGVAEGRESLTLQLRVGKERFTRTVYVKPSA
ncbi:MULTISPECIES: secreted protein [unclassified Nocardioides]|uniref:secreted protein n=1 Tax=unclassified Nocardioides TaxID=2615069 RepID=UPI0000EB630C|nr:MULTISPECIES: secreted protein [unclassified Nocardioides]ABL83447.1 secreted protein [Nocardioides sp. JS614]